MDDLEKTIIKKLIPCTALYSRASVLYHFDSFRQMNQRKPSLSGIVPVCLYHFLYFLKNLSYENSLYECPASGGMPKPLCPAGAMAKRPEKLHSGFPFRPCGYP